MTRMLWVLSIGLLAPIAVEAQDGDSPRFTRFGDPLPVGALARLGTLRFHNNGYATYLPDGKFIVTANSDEIIFRDVATFKITRRLPLEKQTSTVGLIFSHDRKKLAAIGWGGASIHVWDLETFNKLKLVQTGGGSAGGDWSNAAAFSRDDKTLVAATSKSLFVWDVASGRKLTESQFQALGKPVDVRMIAFSEDG
ncbi:MAG TPA: hypothetical protein VGL71_00775, partial [Urbifossiella sp.]